MSRRKAANALSDAAETKRRAAKAIAEASAIKLQAQKDQANAASALIAPKLNSCNVCMDKPATVFFEPCHYVATCLDCTSLLNPLQCLLCRTHTTSTKRLYFNIT